MAQVLVPVQDPFDFLGEEPSPLTPVPGANASDPYEYLGIAPPASAAAPTTWSWANAVENGLLLGQAPKVKAFGEAAATSLLAPFAPTGPTRVAPGVITPAPETDFWKVYENSLNRTNAERSKQGLGKSLTELGMSLPLTSEATLFTPGIGALTSAGTAGKIAAGALTGAETGAIQTPLTGGDVTSNALWGAGVGGGLSSAGSGIKSLVTPKVDPGVIAMAKEAESLGLKLRPSQLAMSSALRKADQLFASGGNEKQLRDFARAVSRTFGADTEAITPQVLDDAEVAVQKRLDAHAATSGITWDKPLGGSLSRIQQDVSGIPQASKDQLREAIEEVKAQFKNGYLSGKAYQRLTGRGGIIENLIKDKNETVSLAGSRIREAVDSALSRSAGPDALADLNEARAQLMNLNAVRSIVESKPTGLINPKDLVAAVRKHYRNADWTTPEAIQTLSQAGQFLPAATAAGDVIAKEKLPWYLRPGFLGPLAGAGEYYAYTQNPKAAAIAAAGAGIALAGKTAVSRGLRSNTYRNMLLQTRPPWMTPNATIPGSVGTVNLLRPQ